MFKEYLIELFNSYPEIALVISVVISIVIAVIGILPSYFVTAANILFFGFWKGTALSYVGECIGAIIAFILYRKGIQQFNPNALDKFRWLAALRNASGRKAIYLVVTMRMMPFIPSGLVTVAASAGKISFLQFSWSSAVGKIPALILEALSVKEIMHFSWLGKLILTLVLVYLMYRILFHKKEKV
jgi:uncharacterized membrane protein YdjX (TVP38/TMEM64 family)